ncbi:MAG: hypothetical protein J7L94_15040 [Caldisericaceae bacterium]|nr:hypothetical protein [Caldisericaceae bacterium]
MKYSPEKHHRRSIRLKGWDYRRPGWYFVTMVTHNRECLFGTVENKKMILGKLWITIGVNCPIIFMGLYTLSVGRMVAINR